MSTFIKKQNLTISIGEYKDAQGQDKKQWRTIGEIVTMKGDDGSEYQFFKMWGAGGAVEGKVFEQEERQTTQQNNPQQQQQYQQQPPQQNQNYQPNQGYADNGPAF
jgi:hypothetical protein